jgi:mRNA interferase RelE/StbE
MRYRLSITLAAKEKLRILPPDVRRNIGHKIFLLEENLSGDVKKLKGSKNNFRLRIGSHRVIFELEGDLITIYDVGDRKGIYR